ncbi:MAG: serine hydrolase domain-containing protein [Deinococcales bacterium]
MPAQSLIEKLLSRHISEDGFSAGAVLASKNGQLVLEHYAGELPAQQQTLWAVASISKMYTVATIMRLVELGEVTLNTLASAVIPEFTGSGREEIRLRHLLTHTSGLIYESPVMEDRIKAQTPFSTLLEEAFVTPLLFKPGTSLSYADYNTLIAGEMVSRIMRQPLPALVKQYLLEPMGLKNTFFPTPLEQDSRVAPVRGVMAEGTDGAMYNSRYARALPHPAFAVTATAGDILRFLLHFAPTGYRVLSDATIRAMTQDQTGLVHGVHPSMKGYDHNAPMPWGFGWALQTREVPALFCELAGFRTFGHGGASGCEMFCDPDADVCVVVLSNSHLRRGREPWYRRLQSLMNTAYVAATTALPPSK